MASSLIPVDYSVKSKGFLGIHPGDLIFRDAEGNTSFQVSSRHSGNTSLKSAVSCTQRTVKNHAGTPLISDVHLGHGHWQGFSGDDCSDSPRLIFIAHRSHISHFQVEVEVNMVRQRYGPPDSSFRLKGNPLQRSCTMYKGCSIVAQTSLLYKLDKAFYSRKKFRLTVYPGMDHALAIALLVIFFG